MPIHSDISKWIKVIVPLDSYDVIEKTQWCWHSVKKDAFPVGDSLLQYSFMDMAHLVGTAFYDMNKLAWDLTKCEKYECPKSATLESSFAGFQI